MGLANVQEEVAKLWDEITTDNIKQLSDLEGYRREFFQLFGFETEGVDYEADIDPDVSIPHLS